MISGKKELSWSVLRETNFSDRCRIIITDGFSAVFDVPDIRKTAVSADDLEF